MKVGFRDIFLEDMEEYLYLAEKAAGDSLSEKRKVGALVVGFRKNKNSYHKAILGEGNNGASRFWLGDKRCEDKRNKTFPHIIHAEMKAIIKAIPYLKDYDFSAIYINNPPCVNCVNFIVEVGLMGVVFNRKEEQMKKVRYQQAQRILQNCGVASLGVDGG